MKAYAPEDYMKMVAEAIEGALGGRDLLIIFFGSVVRGNLRNTSDVDVGIYAGRCLGTEEISRLLDSFESLPMLRDVDWVDLAGIRDPDFLEKVIEEGLVWKDSGGLLTDLRRRLRNLRK